MRRVLHRLAPAALAGAMLVAPACDRGDSAPSDADRAATVTFSPPAAGEPSPRFGVPLPAGATPDAAASTEDTEVFMVAPPVTYGDVNAFYQREMDERPFQDYDWCGPQVDAISEVFLRIWRRADSSDYLVVGLANASPSAPTVIRVTATTGVLVDACAAP